MSERFDWADQARLAVGFAAALSAPGVPAALVNQTDLSKTDRTAIVQVADNIHDAVVEGVQGYKEGEDAASTEPYAEPESGLHVDPPLGNTFGFTPESVDITGVIAEQEALAELDAQTDLAQDVGAEASESEPGLAESAETNMGENGGGLA